VGSRVLILLESHNRRYCSQVLALTTGTTPPARPGMDWEETTDEVPLGSRHRVCHGGPRSGARDLVEVRERAPTALAECVVREVLHVHLETFRGPLASPCFLESLAGTD